MYVCVASSRGRNYMIVGDALSCNLSLGIGTLPSCVQRDSSDLELRGSPKWAATTLCREARVSPPPACIGSDVWRRKVPECRVGVAQTGGRSWERATEYIFVSWPPRVARTKRVYVFHINPFVRATRGGPDERILYQILINPLVRATRGLIARCADG